MPSALASGDKTIFWWKGNVTPPKSYDEVGGPGRSARAPLRGTLRPRRGGDLVLRGLERAEPRRLLDRDTGGLLRAVRALGPRHQARLALLPSRRPRHGRRGLGLRVPALLRGARTAGRLRLDAQLQRRRLPGRARRAAAAARARQGRGGRRRAARRRRDRGLEAPGGRAALHGVERVLLLARPRARPLLLGALHPLAPEARRRRGALDVVLDLQRRVRGGRPGPDAVPRRLRPAEPAGPHASRPSTPTSS